ncbi:MAG: glycosyltransferase family 2 protein [Ignavibacteriales bacterium]|nr:glycosyltransferase family 2 protein [Ignavibacteriales bacterium]
MSVNIITYNRATFLFRCVQSVLDQTFNDFEIVVIDDGSTDNTRSLVRGFRDKRIQYHYHDHSGNIGALRNLALSHSTGAYLALLDSDDMWEQHKLEKQIACMGSNEVLDFTFTDLMINAGQNSKRWFTKNRSYYKERIIPKLFTNWFILPSTVVFRRSVIDRVGVFNTELTSAVEPEYFLRIISQAEHGALFEPLTIRTIHQGQRSLRSGVGSYDVMIMNAGKYYRNGSISFLEYKKILSLLHYRLGCELRKLGQKDGSQRTFAKSIANNPFNIRAWARLIRAIP